MAIDTFLEKRQAYLYIGYLKAALSQIDCSDNFLFFCLGMRQFLRKCLETGDIRLLTKDQIAVFHNYEQKLMFNG